MLRRFPKEKKELIVIWELTRRHFDFLNVLYEPVSVRSPLIFVDFEFYFFRLDFFRLPIKKTVKFSNSNFFLLFVCFFSILRILDIVFLFLFLFFIFTFLSSIFISVDFIFNFFSTSNFVILIGFLEFWTQYLYNWTHLLLLEEYLCFSFQIL